MAFTLPLPKVCKSMGRVKPLRHLLTLAGLLGSVVAVHAQFTWTGLGANRNVATAGNWLGNTPPPNDGSANIALDHALNNTLLLSVDYSFNSVTLNNSDEYLITAAGPQILTLNGGLTASATSSSRLVLSANITLNLVGAQTIDAGASTIVVRGQITGSSAVTLMSSSGTGSGVFVFNNTGSGNTYSGNTTLGDGVNYVGVAFWNSSPFGTGTVTVNPGAGASVQLIAHGTQTVANDFTFNGSGNISLRSWDAPLTYSGNVTLASNTIFSATATQNFISSPGQDGSVPVAGAPVRHPIVFSGTISGASALTTNGAGLLFLTGNNTYSGGTTVNGSTVFGSASSTGTAPVFVNSQGYAGVATPGNFAAFLTHLNPGSGGAVGIDTLSGNATFNDNLDLSSFTNSTIRIGSASTATLSALSTITPYGVATAPYQFGNGGGTLFVQSNLSGTRAVSLSNTSQIPLTLYLQGVNAYTGGTTANNGFIIFDGASALPGAGSLVAAGSAPVVGTSYIGYTNNVVITASAFVLKFTPAATWGIIGFDTGTTLLSNVNLTGYNDGVFLGTTTSAKIDATTLTGSTVGNGSNAANTLRFTAAKNGVLTVNGNLTGTTAVMIGSPYDLSSPYAGYSSGTVVLNGAGSNYSGGTILNAMGFTGPTLEFDTASALGTGSLTVATSPSNGGGLVGLQAGFSGLTLPNSIVLQNAGSGGPQLSLTGANDFTLGGNISGDNTTALTLYNATPLAITLSGNNSGFLGDLYAYNGTLNLNSNSAAGLGNLVFGGGAMTVNLNSASPTLYGLKGTTGNLVIGAGTSLSVDISDDVTHDANFGGVVSGSGSLTVIAPTASQAEALYLGGNNTYSGGTLISGPNAVLALGSNTAAGTGMVTVNAPTGGLILNAGVTFTNNLTFTAGALGGFGNFNPAGGPITFDTGKTVVPGLGNLSKDGPAGTLTFSNNLTFANGGTYLWSLQDVTRADGVSLVNITGNLDITATGGGFNFKVFSFDGTGNPGLANLTYGTPYSLLVLHATGSITGFSPTDFTIDASQFQNDTGAVFTLTNVGNDLFLNFTAVPEPSTDALLGLGLGAVLFPVLRRRKRA